MVQQLEGNGSVRKPAMDRSSMPSAFPGRENSGKLVTLVKQHARLLAIDSGTPLVIIDGPPGSAVQ